MKKSQQTVFQTDFTSETKSHLTSSHLLVGFPLFKNLHQGLSGTFQALKSFPREEKRGSLPAGIGDHWVHGSAVETHSSRAQSLLPDTLPAPVSVKYISLSKRSSPLLSPSSSLPLSISRLSSRLIDLSPPSVLF